MDPMEDDKTGKTKGYIALHSLCLIFIRNIIYNNHLIGK